MKQLFSILSFLILTFAGNSQSVQIQDGAILAVFSVSDSTKVYFSQGNLQYQASTKTWRFAEHQYDTIGADNKNRSKKYDGWIDLFGWGTSGYKSKYPYMATTNHIKYGVIRNQYADITDTKYDWGVYNKISNGGTSKKWRILTDDEWFYLICKRNNALDLKGSATINGIAGMILLPDNWTTPADITFNSGMNGFSNNMYSISEWSKMEANGAVFFPAAGQRSGTSIEGVGVFSYYWSSVADHRNLNNNNFYAICMHFKNDYVAGKCFGYYRSYGISVRLVQDVK